MITTTKKSTPQTTESIFIDLVCETCGFSFVVDASGLDALTVADFVVGRRKPRPIDITKFIDVLDLFNRLTMQGDV